MNKTVILLLVPVIALGAAGCKTDEYWTFGAVRKAVIENKNLGSQDPRGIGGAFLICLGLNLLLLPIAIPHDVWLFQSREMRREGIPPWVEGEWERAGRGRGNRR